VHSVEITLDDVAADAVRADWHRLIQVRLPSAGRHTGPTNRPHITLALTGSMTESERGQLAQIAAGLPLRITVGALLVFGRRQYILSRLVVPNRELLELQRRVIAALDEPVDRHGTFRYGGWTPHITLARRLGPDQIGAAITALGTVRAVDGTAVGLRLWDIQAHREERPTVG
jgi:2'-5' RNA ligase